MFGVEETAAKEEKPMPYDGNPPAYETISVDVAGVDKLIAFFDDERNWIKGAAVRGYRMCTETALRDAMLHRLEDDFLYAAQQVTGFAYTSIPQFNDAPTTSHTLLMAALRQTRENILAGVVPVLPAPGTVPPPAPVGLAALAAEDALYLGNVFRPITDWLRGLWQRALAAKG